MFGVIKHRNRSYGPQRPSWLSGLISYVCINSKSLYASLLQIPVEKSLKWCYCSCLHHSLWQLIPDTNHALCGLVPQGLSVQILVYPKLRKQYNLYFDWGEDVKFLLTNVRKRQSCRSWTFEININISGHIQWVTVTFKIKGELFRTGGDESLWFSIQERHGGTICAHSRQVD